MATETLTVRDPQLRLQCLEAICSDIATGINSARNVLRDNAEDATAAYLIADALDRLGSMADRATVVAGARIPSVVGDAEAWIFGPNVQTMLGNLAEKVRDSRSGAEGTRHG